MQMNALGIPAYIGEDENDVLPITQHFPVKFKHYCDTSKLEPTGATGWWFQLLLIPEICEYPGKQGNGYE